MLKPFPEGAKEHNGPSWAVSRNAFFYWNRKTIKFAFEGLQSTGYGNHHVLNMGGREMLAHSAAIVESQGQVLKV